MKALHQVVETDTSWESESSIFCEPWHLPTVVRKFRPSRGQIEVTKHTPFAEKKFKPPTFVFPAPLSILFRSRTPKASQIKATHSNVNPGAYSVQRRCRSEGRAAAGPLETSSVPTLQLSPRSTGSERFWQCLQVSILWVATAVHTGVPRVVRCLRRVTDEQFETQTLRVELHPGKKKGESLQHIGRDSGQNHLVIFVFRQSPKNLFSSDTLRFA